MKKRGPLIYSLTIEMNKNAGPRKRRSATRKKYPLRVGSFSHYEEEYNDITNQTAGISIFDSPSIIDSSGEVLFTEE